ncbi:hypothetical protein CBR_g50067 [Chara braunii]|uniref:Right handed beta helix domain-containing protein n=1 Tax=Chara braunii TaxID=69332 RepID=A0A388M5W4_CHABU|nr:hypothetical protein CBR_g50067 [Chara braunii]|eukprot:GBG89977.1 hypothetical protein CBR_g50067 [Chara braunii]
MMGFMVACIISSVVCMPPGQGRSLRGAPSAESLLRAAMTDTTTSRYELTASVKLTSSLPALNKDFTLVGNCGGRGCAIDGQGKFRGFVTSSSLSLSNLELVGMTTVGTNLNSDGYDTSGGAVYVSGGPLTVSKCVFRGNRAQKAGGGAIAMLDSQFTISDSMFTENSADGSGGALIVWSNSFGELKNTGLSGNKAGLFGGAAYFRESSVKALSCAFAANKAGNNGGALLLSESDATIAKTSFTANSAPNGLGGALRVLLEDREVVICSSTTFAGNSAQDKTTNDASDFVAPQVLWISGLVSGDKAWLARFRPPSCPTQTLIAYALKSVIADVKERSITSEIHCLPLIDHLSFNDSAGLIHVYRHKRGEFVETLNQLTRGTVMVKKEVEKEDRSINESSIDAEVKFVKLLSAHSQFHKEREVHKVSHVDEEVMNDEEDELTEEEKEYVRRKDAEVARTKAQMMTTKKKTFTDTWRNAFIPLASPRWVENMSTAFSGKICSLETFNYLAPIDQRGYRLLALLT